MEPTFPSEIFIQIFSLLPSKDLPSVIRLCKDFLPVNQSFLYQSVHLKSDGLNVQSTVQLLQRDMDLCKKIKHVTLTTRQTRSSWIPPDFLNGWDNLHSLKMIGLPFHSLHDQEIFSHTLIHACPPLKHFSYQPSAHSFLGRDFKISGLERLSWKTEQSTPLESQIISLMGSSSESLTHISFTGHLSLIGPTCYYDFLDLKFPLLTSLELGSLFDTTSQEESDRAITRFILAHDHEHIQHLSLGKFRIGSTSFQFDENLLSERSLPNLRSFEGFPKNITLLASRGVQCLSQLTSLSLYSDLENQTDINDLSTMFEVARTRLGDIPSVRKLRFEFHTHLNHKMHTDSDDLVHRKWIDQFGDLCRGVIEWYGTLGPVNRDGLADALKFYEHLEIINLPSLSLNLYMPMEESAIISYFRPIAKQSLKLRQVVARKPAYTELKDCVYRFHRGPNGDLDSVSICHGDEWND